jgi:hypothetical protein
MTPFKLNVIFEGSVEQIGDSRLMVINLITVYSNGTVFNLSDVIECLDFGVLKHQEMLLKYGDISFQTGYEGQPKPDDIDLSSLKGLGIDTDNPVDD